MDWNHYNGSRWEDRLQGGDALVMELIASYRAQSAVLDKAIAAIVSMPGRPQSTPAGPTRAPLRAEKTTHKGVAMRLLPASTACVRQLSAGAWNWCVLLPGGECIGKDASPKRAWRQARAWAEEHRPARTT